MTANKKQCKICEATNTKLRKITFKNHYHFYVCSKCIKKNGGMVHVVEVFEKNPFHEVIQNPKVMLMNDTLISLEKDN